MSDKFYITNGVTQDGFGARMQRCLQVMCFVYDLQSKNIPVEYVHTPFSYDLNTPVNQDSTEGVRIRSDFSLANPYPYNDIEHDGYMVRARLWDNALSFNGKTVYEIDLTTTSVKEGIASLMVDLETKDYNNNLYVIRYMHNEYDTHAIDINNFDVYRNKLLSSFTCFTNKISSGKDIAIHIRRKDCLDKGRRFIDDTTYLNILAHLEKLKPHCNITIYTQEVGFNIEQYGGWNVVLDSEINDYDVFMKFVQADHLVVGASSFSYAAALLNTNVVVYHNDGHIPLSRWITYNDYIKLIEQL